MTLNSHWGFHVGDEEWKSPREVVKMLLTCANGKGNLLLNIGPRGDGSIPEASEKIIRQVGAWLENGGREAVTDNAIMKLGAHYRKDDERADWDSAGIFSASENNLFFTMLYCPGDTLTFTGVECKVKRITSAGTDLAYNQTNGKLTVTLSESLCESFCPVIKMECEETPSIYRTGGMRPINRRHVRYDPVSPDIRY
jgi:alpha-L-fucosidase